MPHLLRAERVAQLLETKPATIYDWAQRERIATVRLSEGIVRFRPAAVAVLLGTHDSSGASALTGSDVSSLLGGGSTSHTVDVLLVGDQVLLTAISASTVAGLLDVHEQTIYRWIKAERFPAVWLGPRTLRVRLESVSEFVLLHEVPSRSVEA